jgi:hypothetical protein
MQPVMMCPLFVVEQRFSGCAICKKILGFCSWVAVVVFLENGAEKT